MRTKTILFYFNSMTPAGGIERVIATLANNFSDFMDVTILVKDNPYSHYGLFPNVKILSLNNEIKLNMDSRFSRVFEAFKNMWLSSTKLKSFLKNNNYDYYYIAHPLNALEFQIAKGINSKVIVTEHGGVDAYNFLYKSLKRILYRKAKYYVIPTKTDTGIYKKQGFNAIYIPHFKSNLNYSKSFQNNKIIISIGRLTEAKRQWIIIDLWSQIVHIHNIKDWKLNLVGDGNLKNQYIQKIKDLNLEKYITILPPKKEVEEYYLGASAFILTSKSEGFGMVLLEAISFGLPCISYDCPSGPRDIIINNETGYLVEFDNFEALKSATLSLIHNNNKLIEMGNSAFQSSKKWDDEKILEKWKKIF
ncbi:glycosyl transferase [Flavobacterium columnare]|nr:glycosyl transferase [Flavobacterium columnare]